jgi:DNA-binding MarR family transcriptional regulator
VAQLSDTGDPAASALGALRVMVGIADSTVANVAGELTLTQFRALRTVTERTPVTMSAVARELGVNPSSVTRACARLVALGLVDRARNPLNGRETLLAPTARGRQAVERVRLERHAALSTILLRLDQETRAAVGEAFERFTAAADVPHTVA